MAGHLYRERRFSEPVSEEAKLYVLGDAEVYCNTHTPNFCLKLFLKRGVLPDVLKRGEKFAFLAKYDALYSEAQSIVETDDKDQFTILLAENHDLIEKFPASAFLEEACKHKAVGCATAFFEAGFVSFDINKSIDQNSHFHPLDYGALHLSLALTDLLLQNGANPDIKYGKRCPLARALENLCHNEYVKQWTAEQSMFKLLYILCLPELKEPLDTIKLLASHMKHLEKFCAYIVASQYERKLKLKLSALLLAARDQLLVPSAEGGGVETTSIGQYILRELNTKRKRLSKIESLRASLFLDEARPTVKQWKFAYRTVEFMGKAVKVLGRYHNSDWVKSVPKDEVPFDIAHDLVNDANMVLKPKDVLCYDIKCLQPLDPSKAEVLAKRVCSEKQLRSRTRLPPFLEGISLFQCFPLLISGRRRSYRTCQADIIKPREIRTPSLRNVIASAKKPATGPGPGPGLDSFQVRSSSTMSNSLHRAFDTRQAVNFSTVNPVGIQLTFQNVMASARVCSSSLIWMAKRSIK